MASGTNFPPIDGVGFVPRAAFDPPTTLDEQLEKQRNFPRPCDMERGNTGYHDDENLDTLIGGTISITPPLPNLANFNRNRASRNQSTLDSNPVDPDFDYSEWRRLPSRAARSESVSVADSLIDSQGSPVRSETTSTSSPLLAVTQPHRLHHSVRSEELSEENSITSSPLPAVTQLRRLRWDIQHEEPSEEDIAESIASRSQSPLFVSMDGSPEAPTPRRPTFYSSGLPIPTTPPRSAISMPDGYDPAEGLSSPLSAFTATLPEPAFQRARDIKDQLQTSSRVLKAKKGSGRKRVEDDPENVMILKLRTEHKMDWGAIANFLNEERLKRGEPQTMTQPAVYSRFVRNGPRIAASHGDAEFDPKDYMHLRHPHHYPTTAFEKGANKRTRSDRNGEENRVPREVMNNIRTRSNLANDAQELETAERTEMVVDAVAIVERNFWVFVADELERTTGKLYDPKAIESRFKEL